MNPVMAFCLLCGIACVSIGSARLIAWFFDRREAEAARATTEAALIAQARAEVHRA